MNKHITNIEKAATRIEAFENNEVITWCSGCGNFGMRTALLTALAESGYSRENTVFAFDVGCSGNGSDKIAAYTIHGLHGRVLPLASGMALADRSKKVIAIAGDGATLSEGVNHFLHAIRSNYPLMMIVHNNETYGLTIGQPSATTQHGARMGGTTVDTPPLDMAAMALSANPRFLARSTNAHMEHLTETFKKALTVKDGCAVVEVLQECPTFNKETSTTWMLKNTRYIEKDSSAPKVTDRAGRLDFLMKEKDGRRILGVLYENKKRAAFNAPNIDSTLRNKPGNIAKWLKAH